MLCSFVPLAVKSTFQHFYGSDHFKLFYQWNALAGMASGLMISGLVFSFSAPYLFVGGLLGSVYGLGYCFALRYLLLRKHNDLLREDKFVDREFKLA